MTSDSFEQTLTELMARKPFRPFTIELNTGRRLEVDHALAVAAGDGIAIFIAPGAFRSFQRHGNHRRAGPRHPTAQAEEVARFGNDAAANRLLTREYRKGFEVPARF